MTLLKMNLLKVLGSVISDMYLVHLFTFFGRQ